MINKIKKLLNTAGDSGASEQERETALRMAHALMAKHNLDMASLAEPEESRIDSDEVMYGRPWARTVAHSVAKLFFCKYYIQMGAGGKNDVRHHFVGKESNSLTAMTMSRYLIDSIKTEANKRMRNQGQTVAWRRSFSTGAAHKVWERVEEIQKASTSSEVGTGLILANVYQNELLENAAWLERQGVSLKVRKPGAGKAVDANGYNSGSSYGGTLGLQRQVAGGQLRIGRK